MHFFLSFLKYIFDCTGSLLLCGFCLVAARRPLIVAASLVAEYELQSAGLVVVVRRLSCPVGCAIFPDQGSNLCPKYWQEGF